MQDETINRRARYTISVMKKKGYKQKQKAQAIWKDKSTVSRELQRNCDGRNREYRYELISVSAIRGISQSLKNCVLHTGKSIR